MEKPVNRVKEVLLCLIPAFATLLIFMGVLAAKSIYPFGDNLIDYYDMGQTNAPLYYHIWDFLHGKSSLFYNWYINLGQNLAMGSAIQWNISPFNLYFFFIPRRLVYESLALYMGLRLFFMAFNMGIFLRSAFPKIEKHMFFISALSYGLCGYTLTHYTIPTYLDTAAFLPLLALTLLRLLRERKKLLFTLLLGFATALSYYLSFMHLIYILLFSGVYINLMIGERENRRKAASDLAVCTIGGLLLSSFMLLPSAFEMTLSSRFNSNLSGGLKDTLISILNSVGADEYYIKFLQLFSMEFFIILIIAGVIHFRRERRFVLTVVAAAFIPCALVIFESINILWHFGTYYHYPIRCGYLIPFSLIAAAAALASRAETAEDNSGSQGTGNEWIVYIKYPMLTLFISSAAFMLLYGIYKNGAIWDIKVLFGNWILFSAVVYIMLTIIFVFLKKIINPGGRSHTGLFSFTVLPVVVMELILGACIGYGPPDFTDSFFSDPEQSGEYIRMSVELEDAADDRFRDIPLYRIQRVKNPDSDLNTNYGMVVRHATVTGWANTATRELLTSAEKLGYSTHFMRILDTGGTFLSDSILQVKDVISRLKYDDSIESACSLKRVISSKYDFYIYHNELSLPFGMPVSEDIDNIDLGKNSIADNNNLLYNALSCSEDGIADVVKMDDMKDGIISVSGKKALYLYKGRAKEIRDNGKLIPVPTIGDMENTAYPAWFNSNLLLLGIFENEDVVIQGPEKSRILLFDMDKMSELSKKAEEEYLKSGYPEPVVGKADVSFSVNGSDERNRLLIPISYSPGWAAEVNGRKAVLKNFNGICMTLPIDEGENNIRLKFTPPGLIPGMVISILTLLVIVMLTTLKTLSEKSEKLMNSAGPVLYFLFNTAFVLAALALYIIPIGWFMVHQVMRHLL